MATGNPPLQGSLLPRTVSGSIYLTTALALSLWCAAGWSLESNLLLEGEGVYSDNIGLREVDPESEWALTTSAGIELFETEGNIDGWGTALIQYRDYQNGLFDDETLFSFSGAGSYQVVPERYSWWVEDYFRQASIDALAAPTPSNRQDTNVLSLGPEGQWRLTPLQTLVAGARLGHFYFENTEADSIRYSGYGEWRFDFSRRTDISAHAEVSKIDYTSETQNPNYLREDIFLRFVTAFPRGPLELDLGQTYIDRDEHDNVDGFLGRLGWTYNLTSTSTLEAYGLTQYTDAGHDILTVVSRGRDIGILDEQLSGDVFLNRQGEIAYYRRGVLFSLRLSGIYRDEDYEITDRDRTIEQGNIALTGHYSEALRATLRFSHRDSEYHDVVRDDRDRSLGLTVAYRWRPRLEWILELARRERESTLEGADFDENRGLISLRYATGRETQERISERR